jgi:hypothetical protein
VIAMLTNVTLNLMFAVLIVFTKVTVAHMVTFATVVTIFVDCCG